MIKRLIFIVLFFAAIVTMSTNAQTRYAWKESAVPAATVPANNPRANEGIEVYSKSGALIIRNPERASVVVMTILGQTISSTTINAGTHELRIGTHGIYIVKIGSYTIRVAL